jgi:molecular chaperone IbpA
MNMTTYIATFDLPTLTRNAVGFDRMFHELNRTFTNSKNDGNYPPHNIVQLTDTQYQIEVAVAGFAENEIEIELKENLLTVSGEQIKRDDVTYLHKGIGTRNFVRTFPLGEHVEVKGAAVKNGILTVDLELLVPEEKQSKKIAITFQK